MHFDAEHMSEENVLAAGPQQKMFLAFSSVTNISTLLAAFAGHDDKD
jgi:hypothetical protein